MSYLEIGKRIADHFSLDKNLIKHVKTKDLNQKAERPFKTGFDLERSIRFLGYNPTSFNKSLDLGVNLFDKSQIFLDKLKDIDDPEEKRKIIGLQFIEEFQNITS